jgi:predicted Zn finger-like uncharacterized protein
MILVCPSCDTRYFAEDSSIGKEGRRVRCATCGHAWHAKLPDEGETAVAAEDTGLTREQVERLRQTAQANSKARAGPHAEFRAREHAKRKRAKSHAVSIAWVSTGVLFLGAIGGAVLFRNEVAQAFPKVASIYRLVGLDVNRYGVTLENVVAKRSFDGTTPVLTVTGAAVNISDEARPTPALRVTLKDEGGAEVQTWTDKLAVPQLGPGERTEFTSRFEAPPVETYRLTVTFAYDGEQDGKATHIEATSDGEEAPHAEPGHAAPAGGGESHDIAASGEEASPTAAHPPAAVPVKEADHH